MVYICLEPYIFLTQTNKQTVKICTLNNSHKTCLTITNSIIASIILMMIQTNVFFSVHKFILCNIMYT